jgi:hypothetical protein
MSKVVVIGFQRPDEYYTLFMIGQWLESHRRGGLARRLKKGDPDLDLYDMTTLPEKGDGLDAIGDDTALVVALHLFGIDKLPGGNTAKVTEIDAREYYNRDNLRLLKICMERNVPLVAVGDQPWLGLEKRTRMYGDSGEPLTYLYEKRAAQ